MARPRGGQPRGWWAVLPLDPTGEPPHLLLLLVNACRPCRGALVLICSAMGLATGVMYVTEMHCSAPGLFLGSRMY